MPILLVSSRLVTILFVMMAVIFTYIFYDISVLPDYLSYKEIYLNSVYDTDIYDWEPLFVLYNQTLLELDLSYEAYRTVTFFISVILLLISVFYSELINKKHNIEKSAILVIFLIILYFVLVEFFLVRIRAGLAFSVFIFGFVIYLNSSRTKFYLFPVWLIIYSCSYFIHASTFILMMYFFIVPHCFYLYADGFKIRFFNKNLSFNAWFFSFTRALLMLTLACAILFKIISGLSIRGEWLYVPLNSVRFFSLSLFPLGFYFVSIVFNKRKFSFSYDRNGGLVRQPDLNTFIFYNYFFFILALVVFYYAGLLSIAGEAIVRVYTLSSLIAFYFIMKGSKREYYYFWLIVSGSNSTFFIHTLLTEF